MRPSAATLPAAWTKPITEGRLSTARSRGGGASSSVSESSSRYGVHKGVVRTSSKRASSPRGDMGGHATPLANLHTEENRAAQVTQLMWRAPSCGCGVCEGARLLASTAAPGTALAPTACLASSSTTPSNAARLTLAPTSLLTGRTRLVIGGRPKPPFIPGEGAMPASRSTCCAAAEAASARSQESTTHQPGAPARPGCFKPLPLPP
mmetsp:Transcript_56013/g.149422  ORF Transcript_56013/g.149422 Transcript_56013/m.149422 type:complete len:207 (+) Transcript_56013:142-762(+)